MSAPSGRNSEQGTAQARENRDANSERGDLCAKRTFTPPEPPARGLGVGRGAEWRRAYAAPPSRTLRPWRVFLRKSEGGRAVFNTCVAPRYQRAELVAKQKTAP